MAAAYRVCVQYHRKRIQQEHEGIGINFLVPCSLSFLGEELIAASSLMMMILVSLDFSPSTPLEAAKEIGGERGEREERGERGERDKVEASHHHHGVVRE